jgi:glutamate--cysteine ligase
VSPEIEKDDLVWLTDEAVITALASRRMGLEKEGLRVDKTGDIAQSEHPLSLGKSLTHPWITTDYAESLLEFVTPVLSSASETIEFLADLHRFTVTRIDPEILWAASMPCRLAGEGSIPLAQYGSSHGGMMKHIYRRGLGYRYGKVMQVIAGIHFNYSFGETWWQLWRQRKMPSVTLQAAIDEGYFAMLRNLQRVGWLIPYLMGASPAVDRSFLAKGSDNLAIFDSETLYQPWATSLRMGDIGYQNNQENETGIKACYDSLPAYIESLRRAISTPCPEYQKIGIKVAGEYRQLNANILQIENEYYTTVRPKQPPQGYEKPTQALASRGVRYIELRSIDINPYYPAGISELEINFLEVLMVWSLLAPSPVLTSLEQAEIDENEMSVAQRGRAPELMLRDNLQDRLLKGWAREIMASMVPIAEIMDRGTANKRCYQHAVNELQMRIEDSSLTPSARIIAEMKQQQESHLAFVTRYSRHHQKALLQQNITQERLQQFENQVALSIKAQQERERHDEGDFATFLANYLAS